MKDAAFASRYDIPASTLVLSRMEGGEETAFERLDDVWMKIRDRDAFSFRWVRLSIGSLM